MSKRIRGIPCCEACSSGYKTNSGWCRKADRCIVFLKNNPDLKNHKFPATEFNLKHQKKKEK